MAMAFWPGTDYLRVVTLMETAQAALTPVAPWTGFDTIYDPASFVDPPAVSEDPITPTIFATWGVDMWAPVETQDPDTPGPRTIELMVAIFQQKPSTGGGSASGASRAFAQALWAQLQAASVSGLQLVTQSMRWTDPPGREDPDFFESRMTVELHSD